MIGIYKITNLANGKFYIGSSVKCNDRRKTHFSKLKNNRHYNSHLQSAYNKYGGEYFVFDIMIEFPVNTSLKLIEQIENLYIIFFKPAYNKTENTKRNNSLKVHIYKSEILESTKERCNSEVFKIKMSRATKAYYASLDQEQKDNRNKHKIGKPLSEATKLKISKSHLGKKHSIETKLKQSESIKQFHIDKKRKSND